MDELERAKHRYRVGDHIRATVTRVPRPGAIGVFLDLDHRPGGFIDFGHLPLCSADWPRVGTRLDCEVLHHRVGQMRLWPLDPRWRNDLRPFWGTAAAWEATEREHPVGSVVTARVVAVYVSDRSYFVEFGGRSALLDYYGAVPAIGDVGRYRVTEHLGATRRLRLVPEDRRPRETGATPRQDAVTPDEPPL